jgi:hypothetical protein
MLQKPRVTQNSCKSSSSSSSRCIRISPSKHSARQISPPTDPIRQLASLIGCWWVCATRLIVGGCVKEEEEEKKNQKKRVYAYSLLTAPIRDDGVRHGDD